MTRKEFAPLYQPDTPEIFLPDKRQATLPTELSSYSHNSAIDGDALATSYKIPPESPLTPIESICVAGIPKPEKEKSGDVAIVRLLSPKKVFILIGDGLTPVESPPDKLIPLLKKYGCLNCPDALIGSLLQDPTFADPLFAHLSTQKNLADFFSSLEHFLKIEYEKLGLTQKDLDKIENSHLPSIVGVVCTICQETIEIASIGDPVCWGIDSTRVPQALIPTQNIGFDTMTRSKINSIIKNDPNIHTVSQAKTTEKFRQWLIFTYRKKINKPGGVSVVNGKNFSSADRPLQASLSTNFFNSLVLASDGLTLGAHHPDRIITAISQIYEPFELTSFIKRRRTNQARGFRNGSVCPQEKKDDDIAVVTVGLKDILEQTEFKPFISETPIEEILGDTILPWQLRTLALWREKLDAKEIANILIDEGYNENRIGQAKNRPLKKIIWIVKAWINVCKKFNPSEERQKIEQLSQIIDDPVNLLIYRLSGKGKAWGWTLKSIAEQVKKIYGVNLSPSQIRTRGSTTREKISRAKRHSL